MPTPATKSALSAVTPACRQTMASLERGQDELVNSHAARVEALSSLISVMDDSSAPGTNVDGKWMGVPDWEVVDQARLALHSAQS